ncbi:hypothetical protein JTE90_017903 [Oedothorax gibbosus]|uniref:Fibronectin type-III domain-containing protein n=1 Tax=Oedothorax gibbosus TaxID=931172 RepID=A0AAV6VHW6_9ARAC|nr:hypothetical protein JTE90_017903 [Oedothorax gibbosus]
MEATVKKAGAVEIKQEPIEQDEATPAQEEPKIDKKEETQISIIPKGPNFAYLITTDEEDLADVEGPDTLIMTAEEIRNYIEKSVFEEIINNNPMDVINSNAGELLQRMKAQRDEFSKLAKLVGIIEKNQEEFLRSKLKGSFTKDVSSSVDLPPLPRSQTNGAVSKQGVVTPSPNDKIIYPSSKVKATDAPSTSGQQQVQKPMPDIECIDLTDETEAPAKPAEPVKKNQPAYSFLGMVKHPAPLPPKPFAPLDKNLPPLPPKPRLKISSEERGIVLQWDMAPNTPDNRNYAPLTTFDIFGYQEQKNITINTLLWKKIGSVKAMALPMACTLTQFIEGHKYHFAVRAMDEHNRYGFYSDPISITYQKK